MSTKLDKNVFGSFVVASAIVTFILQVAGKKLAPNYSKMLIISATQIISFVLAVGFVLIYLGPTQLASQITNIRPMDWLYIAVAALGGVGAFAIALHTLKTEDISDHGILDTAAGLFIGLLGGYLVFNEGVSFRRMLAAGAMIIAAGYAVRS